MNCCCGTASDLYFCVTGKSEEEGVVHGSANQGKSVARRRLCDPTMEGRVFASASGRFPDLVAK